MKKIVKKQDLVKKIRLLGLKYDIANANMTELEKEFIDVNSICNSLTALPG